MSGIYGLEKFSYLEDKIYRTIEQFKRERQEKESLEKEVMRLEQDVSRAVAEKERLELQVDRLLKERDEIRDKVESMLDAIEMVELEAEPEAVGE